MHADELRTVRIREYKDRTGLFRDGHMLAVLMAVAVQAGASSWARLDLRDTRSKL